MSKFDFNPTAYKKSLLPLIQELNQADRLTKQKYHYLLRRYPKTKTQLFTKAEIIAALRHFKLHPHLIKKIRMKPIRTLSGVVPVTLLTKPYPCPGQCLYCPNDPLMPKSYLKQEPGAQRGLKNQFDPYLQVSSRLKAYHAIGHPTDKVELIILGGTWSAYPLAYRIWFIKRCFEALNSFPLTKNKRLSADNTQTSTWQELVTAQHKNETASCRCVGLSLETRPDFITPKEVITLRRLGCTKVQLGLQSLNSRILKLNQRGHTIKASQAAIKLLRQAGFKIQVHWMANLYGSSPAKDIADFNKLFTDYHFRPDELKIYPTSLIATAKLMDYFQKGLWQPYTQAQLIQVLIAVLPLIPAYCRLTRMMRDFSAQDIVAGSTTSNLRQLIEKAVIKQKQTIHEIRFREIRRQPLKTQDLKLKTITYKTSIGQEKFLQFVTPDNQIVAFLRLSFPVQKPFIKELNYSVLLREVHVYGQALAIGESHQAQAQHSGLGSRLISHAAQLAQRRGYKQLSVISAIGTKQYYRNQGFQDGRLYQHLQLTTD